MLHEEQSIHYEIQTKIYEEALEGGKARPFGICI